tara:strand:+ start:280 stop:621 length:342 start_codon:yes stop_codon:yes gene_type:complete
MQIAPIFTVDFNSFKEDIVNRTGDIPVLVDFWADWCAPCISINPNITAVVNDFEGRIQLAKLEVDSGENMKLVSEYNVRGFPTIIMFLHGKEIARFSGSRSQEWIKDWISGYL